MVGCREAGTPARTCHAHDHGAEGVLAVLEAVRHNAALLLVATEEPSGATEMDNAQHWAQPD